MLTSTLFTLLLALATVTVDGRVAHPNTRGNHDRAIRAAREHAVNLARSQEKIVRNVERRENTASTRDGLRKVKARNCKAHAKTSATTSSAVTSSTSATAVNYAQQAVTSSSATAAAVTVTSSTSAAAATTSATTSSAATTSAATTSAATTSTSTTSTSSSSLTPNGIKAGVSGDEAVPFLGSHISWFYDWTPTPSASGSTSAIGIPMLWGDGSVDGQDASRLAAFKAITSTPKYVIGFEEPDCSTYGSANIGVSTAASIWDNLIAPMGAAGSILLSPSMCHQADETYLTPFSQAITRQWDVTNLHINKNSMAGVQKDLDYYWNTYKKPMWVTEFACVDDSTSFIPCTDQNEINSFINDIVALFEADSRVYAYAYSSGEGLGDVWPPYANGALTESGQTYLNAISQYH